MVSPSGSGNNPHFSVLPKTQVQYLRSVRVPACRMTSKCSTVASCFLQAHVGDVIEHPIQISHNKSLAKFLP